MLFSDSTHFCYTLTLISTTPLVKMHLEQPCGCVAMKAPVGLSSRRAVCVSRWKGFALTSVRAATNAKNKNQIPLNMPRVQQRRPLPAAEAGRSCWGRGQQSTSALHEVDAGSRNPYWREAPERFDPFFLFFKIFAGKPRSASYSFTERQERRDADR